MSLLWVQNFAAPCGSLKPHIKDVTLESQISWEIRCEKCSFDHEKVEKGVFMCSNEEKRDPTGIWWGCITKNMIFPCRRMGRTPHFLSSKNGKTMISHQIWGPSFRQTQKSAAWTPLRFLGSARASPAPPPSPPADWTPRSGRRTTLGSENSCEWYLKYLPVNTINIYIYVYICSYHSISIKLIRLNLWKRSWPFMGEISTELMAFGMVHLAWRDCWYQLHGAPLPPGIDFGTLRIRPSGAAGASQQVPGGPRGSLGRGPT